jgi:hypothetical protein
VSPSGLKLPFPAQSEAFRRATLAGFVAIVALYYALGHLNWYLGTPLGRVPVLDERENIDLANAIFGGTLPREPFYRAPGYALVLAGLRFAGIPPQGLFPAALLLGVFLHGTSSALVALTAGRWFGTGPAAVAGLLYALDPVLVHYATQALDATLGLTLFIAGLRCFTGAVVSPARATAWAWASALWALAALVRPSYLAAWMLVPAFAAFQPIRWRWRTAVLAASLSGAVLFEVQAAWQWRVCGEPGFLPWQGAYNLWAANRPGSNGRFYSQRSSLSAEVARANPARAESAALYRQETGGDPADITRMNAHWRGAFLGEVAGHPFRWLGLMARKAYALANNWEQYNNKTFAFHKARSPWLAWNPICWGFLFSAAVAGAARLAAGSPRLSWAVAAAAAACAAGVLLFYASARFRLPLVAIAAVLAGGALGSPDAWRAFPRGRMAAVAALVALAAALSFSRLGGVADPSTFVQDHALLARAAFTVGDDATAVAEANEALGLQPWHPDAKAILEAVARDAAAGKGQP